MCKETPNGTIHCTGFYRFAFFQKYAGLFMGVLGLSVSGRIVVRGFQEQHFDWFFFFICACVLVIIASIAEFLKDIFVLDKMRRLEAKMEEAK